MSNLPISRDLLGMFAEVRTAGCGQGGLQTLDYLGARAAMQILELYAPYKVLQCGEIGF
jgi:hypothetical protein